MFLFDYLIQRKLDKSYQREQSSVRPWWTHRETLGMSATEVARSLHSSAPGQARAQAGHSIGTEEILIKHMDNVI